MKAFFLVAGGIAFGYALSLAVHCTASAYSEWAQQMTLDAIHTHWVWEQQQMQAQMFEPDLVGLNKEQGRH